MVTSTFPLVFYCHIVEDTPRLIFLVSISTLSKKQCLLQLVFPSAIRIWNQLPSWAHAESLNLFKHFVSLFFV